MRTVTICLISVLLVNTSTAFAADKPNIVIILADDLGYADLGCQGCKDIPTPRKRPGAKRGRIQEAFRRADRNGDGKLSADEFPRPDVFKSIDRDGDGFATPEEVREFYNRRRGAANEGDGRQ